MKNNNKVFIGLCLAIVSYVSVAEIPYIDAKVNEIESSSMPSSIRFKIDGALPECPSNTPLYWAKDADNNKATYALLLTAFATQKKIRVFYEKKTGSLLTNDLECYISNMQINNVR